MARASVTTTRRSNMAAPGDAQERQLAWQREMERAQLSNWFKPDLALRNSSATPRPASPTRGAVSQSGGLQDGRPSTTVTRASIADTLAPTLSTVISEHLGNGAPMGPGSGQFVSAKVFPHSEECEIPVVHRALPAAPPLDRSSCAKASLNVATNRIEATESSPFIPTSSGEPPSVLRLHAESRPEGQAVWIAMRANDDSLRAALPGIVTDLQRAVRERGGRLHLVVCNGRPVWRDGIALAYGDNEFDSFHTREI